MRSDLAGSLHNNPERAAKADTVSVWIGGDDLVRSGLQLLQDSGSPVESVIHRFEGKIEEVFDGAVAVHPNDRGHSIIAARLLPFVYPR